MNDLQIDYFMAVATNLSFTKTSEELFVSQPAISRQIALLEKEVGAKLFKRNNQRTELTEVGKLYFDLFSRYKADLVNTRVAAEALLNRKRGMMRLGFLEGWDLQQIIPEMMERFKAEYPDTEVVVNCCGVKEISTLLLTNGLDVAVTMSNSVRGMQEFECAEAAGLDKIILYAAGHPLADKENLAPADFKNDIFYAPWEIVDKMVIESINSNTRPYGFTPELRFVRNYESMVTCVRNNMGVAIMDEWAWAKNSPDLRWIPMNSKDSISVVRLKSAASDRIKCMENMLVDILKNIE